MTAFPMHSNFGASDDTADEVAPDPNGQPQLQPSTREDRELVQNALAAINRLRWASFEDCLALRLAVEELERRAVAEERHALGYVVVAKNTELGRVRPMGLVYPDVAGAEAWRDSLFGPLGLSQPTYVIGEVRELPEGNANA